MPPPGPVRTPRRSESRNHPIDDRPSPGSLRHDLRHRVVLIDDQQPRAGIPLAQLLCEQPQRTNGVAVAPMLAEDAVAHVDLVRPQPLRQ